MATDEQKAAVRAAIEDGTLIQDGAHFYAVDGGEKGEHVATGYDDAFAHLGAGDPDEDEAADQQAASVEESPEDETPEDETSDEEAAAYDLEATYRHEGESVLSFSRPDRADGMIWPGQNVRYDARNVPIDESPELQQAINDGILRPLPK